MQQSSLIFLFMPKQLEKNTLGTVLQNFQKKLAISSKM